MRRSGEGAATAMVTTLLAFTIAGLVVLLTGHNPLLVYKGIFNGTGLSWFFPWVTGDDRINAAAYLQGTLLLSTTLMCTGLAVGFAFRCGLFNIGGQGQWIVGAVVSVWAGHAWAGMARPLHITLVIVVAVISAAAFAGIAGILKATVGAHEVITTIMLNWIAYWVGSYLFGLGGPLQAPDRPDPISSDIADSAKIPVFWGDADLQGLHIGFFLAISMLVVYWLTLSRTTLGFRVRAVGQSPEAARYGGIGVGKSYFLAMAISGGFAGLGGALDVLGWTFRLGQSDVQLASLGFIGIAVALLGRNSAIGIGLASLLFGALIFATTDRTLDPVVLGGEGLGGHLTEIIQGLVVLFVGADVVVLALWRRRKQLRTRRAKQPVTSASPITRRNAGVEASQIVRRAQVPIIERLVSWTRAHRLNHVRLGGITACVVGVVAFLTGVPPITSRSAFVPIVLALAAAGGGLWVARRGLRRLGYSAVVLAVLGGSLGALATRSSVSKLDGVFVWSGLLTLTLIFATPLIFGALGGIFSERSGVVNIGLEGMMLCGAFFGFLGADKMGHWVWGIVAAALSGLVLALIHAVVSIHWRADQIVSGVAVNFLALGITGYFFIKVYGLDGTPSGAAEVPNVRIGFLDGVPLLEGLADLNLLIWVSLAMIVVTYVAIFKTAFGLRLRSVGEHPRAAETLGLSVYRIRYTAVCISGMIASLGGAFLSIGFNHSFNENMIAGRGFIALAAMIFGNWKPKVAFFATLLFGFSTAIAQKLPVYSTSLAILFQALPYVLCLVAVGGLLGRPRPPAYIGVPYKRP